MKTVLVTGGAGYVGSRLTPLLLENGYKVKVIDLCLYGDYGVDALKAHKDYSSFKDRFELIREDIRDYNAVKRALEGVDTVVHLAAISNDPTGDLDERLTKQVNFDAVGLLVNTAKEMGIKRFINASSSSVFGTKDEENISEALEPEPITFYSKYKMLSEWIVRSAASSEFTTVNIRPATVCGYSPRQRLDLTVNKLTADALRKGLITVHGGEQRRPNVGITDMVNLYLKLIEIDAEKINGKTFNFGFENLKVIEIAKTVQSELGSDKVDIQVQEVFDNRDYHITSNKLLTELAYEPVSSIKDEVMSLREHLASDFKSEDIDADRFYNMKMMKLERHNGSYALLSR